MKSVINCLFKDVISVLIPFVLVVAYTFAVYSIASDNSENEYKKYRDMYLEKSTQVSILEQWITSQQLIIEGYQHSNTFKATVTAYTARPQETNEDPENTSILQKPIPGWTVAVSRDLGKWKGKRIYIDHPNYGGVWYVNDYMNKRYDDKQIDILVDAPSEAFTFGVQEAKVYLIEPYVPFDKELYCEPNPSRM